MFNQPEEARLKVFKNSIFNEKLFPGNLYSQAHTHHGGSHHYSYQGGNLIFDVTGREVMQEIIGYLNALRDSSKFLQDVSNQLAEDLFHLLERFNNYGGHLQKYGDYDEKTQELEILEDYEGMPSYLVCLYRDMSTMSFAVSWCRAVTNPEKRKALREKGNHPMRCPRALTKKAEAYNLSVEYHFDMNGAAIFRGGYRDNKTGFRNWEGYMRDKHLAWSTHT